MPESRDQQGRFISSSKNSWWANSAGQSQEGKELNQPNYLSSTTRFISKKKPKSFPQESKIVQGSLDTEGSLSENQITEQYHLGEFLFSWGTFRKKGQHLEINGIWYFQGGTHKFPISS